MDLDTIAQTLRIAFQDWQPEYAAKYPLREATEMSRAGWRRVAAKALEILRTSENRKELADR